MRTAERLRRSERLQQLTDDLLGEAERASDVSDMDAILDEAADNEEEARAENAAAWSRAAQFGLDEPWPPEEGAAEIAREVRSRLNELEDSVTQLDDHALSERFEELSGRFEQMDG